MRLGLLVTYLLLLRLPITAQLEQADRKITAVYDRFTGETTVQVMVRVRGAGFDGLAMMASYKYKDSELKFIKSLQEELQRKGDKPLSSLWFKPLKFGFAAVSKKQQFKETDSYIMLIDGQRWQPSVTSAVEVTPQMKLTVEAFVADVSAEEIIKICKANKVEVRLGREEFVLTKEQLQPVRVVAANLLAQSLGQPSLIEIEQK